MKNESILLTGRLTNQQGTQNDLKRSAQPIHRASKRIAQRLGAIQPSSTGLEINKVDIEKFSRAMNVVFSKYMPVPEHLCALSIMNPRKSNPLIQIAKANNIADFVKGVNELLNAIGLGQEGKTDDYRALISGFQHTNAPQMIIGIVAQALEENELLSAPVDAQQSEDLYNAYSKLCHSILSYNDPETISSSLYKTKQNTSAAQTFLKSLCSVTQIDLDLKRPVDRVCYAIVLGILKEDHHEFENLPHSLKSNRVFLREGIIDSNWQIFNCTTPDLKNDPWFQKLVAYKSGLLSLRNPHDAEDINDFNLVRAAASHKADVLEHAGDEIKNNSNRMLYLILHLGDGFKYAGEALKANRRFVMEVLKSTPGAILYVSNQFKNDPEIVEIAFAQQERVLRYIKSNPLSFLRLPDQFKNDRLFVLESIISLGSWVLNTIPIELHNNPWLQKLADYRVGIHTLRSPQDAEDIHDIQLVRAAAAIYGKFTLRHLPDTIRNNPEHMLRLIKDLGFGFEYAGDALKANRRFVIESAKLAPVTIKDVSAEFKDDAEICKIVVAQRGKLIREIGDNSKGNQEIVMTAIRNYPAALQDACLELRRNINVVLEAVCKEPKTLRHAAAGARKSDVVIAAALKRDSSVIKYIHNSKKKEPRIILEAIKTYPQALAQAHHSLGNNPNFVQQAINTNPRARHYMSAEIKNTHIVATVTRVENGHAELVGYRLKPK